MVTMSEENDAHNTDKGRFPLYINKLFVNNKKTGIQVKNIMQNI